MTDKPPVELDRIFAALAHPVRRAILERCGRRRHSITELAQPHAMSLNAISKHVKFLESANLVSREIDRNVHLIRTRPEPAKQALDWLSHHMNLWDTSLMALKNQMEGRR